MSCLKEVMKDYRSEVQDVLSADRQLANEIEFDLKRFEEQQKEIVEEQRRKQSTPRDSLQVWSLIMIISIGNRMKYRKSYEVPACAILELSNIMSDHEQVHTIFYLLLYILNKITLLLCFHSNFHVALFYLFCTL